MTIKIISIIILPFLLIACSVTQALSEKSSIYISPYTQLKFHDALNHSKLQYNPYPYISVTMPGIKAFANENFYLDKSYMVFVVNKAKPDNGDRTELRQQISPGNDSDNWYTSQNNNSMSATLKVVNADMNETTVLQIHEKDGKEKPLLRMAYIKSMAGKINNIWAIILLGDGSYEKKAMGQVDDNLFSCTISVVKNSLRITTGSSSITNDVSYWSGRPSYFKAGCYPQGTGIAKVYIDQISYIHTK